MTKWIALFIALVGNGAPVEVVDEDGPREFATEQACRDHVEEAIPKLNDILKSYTANVDMLLIGECNPEPEGKEE